MQEISFTVPVSGRIRIDRDKVTITVDRAETVVRLEGIAGKQARISLPRGTTLFDVVLATARQVAADMGTFTAADLYHEALNGYPDLKRGSWTAHVIASAPEDPSQKNYGVKRDYLQYTGNGEYRLKPEYAGES